MKSRLLIQPLLVLATLSSSSDARILNLNTDMTKADRVANGGWYAPQWPVRDNRMEVTIDTESPWKMSVQDLSFRHDELQVFGTQVVWDTVVPVNPLEQPYEVRYRSIVSGDFTSMSRIEVSPLPEMLPSTLHGTIDRGWIWETTWPDEFMVPIFVTVLKDWKNLSGGWMTDTLVDNENIGTFAFLPYSVDVVAELSSSPFGMSVHLTDSLYLTNNEMPVYEFLDTGTDPIVITSLASVVVSDVGSWYIPEPTSMVIALVFAIFMTLTRQRHAIAE